MFSAKKDFLYFLLFFLSLTFCDLFSRQILIVQSVKAWKSDASNSELSTVL